MSKQTREGRIVPLVWYNLWEYKLYFVQIGKWYAKVYPRKTKEPVKTPLLTFEGETKLQVVQKLDDHCLRNFWKIYRFNKVRHQEPVRVWLKKEEPKVHHVAPRIVSWNQFDLSKWFEDLNKKMLETYAYVLHDLKTIRTITVLWTMLSALAVTMIMLLDIMK